MSYEDKKLTSWPHGDPWHVKPRPGPTSSQRLASTKHQNETFRYTIKDIEDKSLQLIETYIEVDEDLEQKVLDAVGISAAESVALSDSNHKKYTEFLQTHKKGLLGYIAKTHPKNFISQVREHRIQVSPSQEKQVYNEVKHWSMW